MKRALVIFCVLGCGHAAAPDAGSDDPTLFIAFAADFAPYRTWPSFHVDAPSDGNAEHPLGPFTAYYNRAPPHGATEFPVGTMVVKAIEQPSGILLVAIAKRGGGYNPDGAVGWEFFQLEETSTALTLAWRGLGPPIGGAYGGDALTCNTCHLMGKANDYLLSGALNLGGF